MNDGGQFPPLVTYHLSLITAFMSPDRWKQIEELYHAALKLELSQRAAFLEEACQRRRRPASRGRILVGCLTPRPKTLLNPLPLRWLHRL